MARLTLRGILPPSENADTRQGDLEAFVFLASSHERDASENEARFGGPTADDYLADIVF